MLRDTTEPGSTPCDGTFGTLAATVYADLEAPAATCTCACDAVGEPTCELASDLTQYENQTCNFNGNNEETWQIGAACNAAVAAAAGTSVRAFDVQVEGVTCEPSFTEDVIPANFARELSLCASDGATEACDGEGVCVPPLGEKRGELCVWREGDFPCPESWARARYLHYREFIDERRCSECTCDEFYGECSGITVLLFGTNACNEAPVAGVSPGSCELIGNQGATAARRSGIGVPQVDCSGEVMGGESVGSAGPTSPVTVCCLE